MLDCSKNNLTSALNSQVAAHTKAAKLVMVYLLHSHLARRSIFGPLPSLKAWAAQAEVRPAAQRHQCCSRSPSLKPQKRRRSLLHRQRLPVLTASAPQRTAQSTTITEDDANAAAISTWNVSKSFQNKQVCSKLHCRSHLSVTLHSWQRYAFYTL